VWPAAELERKLLPADRDIEGVTVVEDARVALRDRHTQHHKGVLGDGQVTIASRELKSNSGSSTLRNGRAMASMGGFPQPA
jgi:hypothetical protein